jgi:putative transposase
MLQRRGTAWRSARRSKWVARARRTGSASPGQIGGHRVSILTGHRDWLIDRTKRDFTLRGLVAELADREVKVDYVQVWRFVHAEGLSFKKKRAARRTVAAVDRAAAGAVEKISGSA